MEALTTYLDYLAWGPTRRLGENSPNRDRIQVNQKPAIFGSHARFDLVSRAANVWHAQGFSSLQSTKEGAHPQAAAFENTDGFRRAAQGSDVRPGATQ